MTTPLRVIGEVEVDARRRVSLGKAGRREDTKFVVLDTAAGVIVLVPVKSVLARNLLEVQEPGLAELVQEGVEQAAAGRIRPRAAAVDD